MGHLVLANADDLLGWSGEDDIEARRANYSILQVAQDLDDRRMVNPALYEAARFGGGREYDESSRIRSPRWTD